MILRIAQKTKHTVTIELDSVSRGSLPQRMLPAAWPVGFAGEASPDEVGELLAILRQRAWNLLLDWVAQAERSSFQARNFLKKKLFDQATIDAILDDFRENNYLDDARFAAMLIRSYSGRRASKREIVAKLRAQRIPTSVWEPLLAELYSPAEAKDNLAELLAKYCATHRDLPRPKLREKAFTFLYRKGFDLEDIQAAWNSLDSD